jgi:4-hydroxy-tetrahydrodipicolinate synthase
LSTPICGVIPPLITPLTDGGTVDESSFEALISHQLDAGVSGLFVLGSSGEAAYLDDRTRERVVEVASTIVAGEVPLLVGALDSAPARVHQQVSWIDRHSVSGLVVTAPFYANPSVRETAEHFRSIAHATSLPVYAYDIPANVGRRLEAEMVVELLSEKTLAGIKDSSGSLAEFRIILDSLDADSDAAVLSGADVLADLALELGAHGLIPGLANIRPDLFVGLVRAHRDADDKAVQAHQRAITALAAIFKTGEAYGLGRHSSELGALKHFLHQRGVIATTQVSQPMTPLPEAGLRDLDRIHNALQARFERDLS